MKKILAVAAVVSALFSASASAQSQTPGSLLFPTSNDTTLMSWATETVNAFLAAHQIPASQWTVIQQYGRQDVYDSLRSFAWLRMQEMITRTTPLTTTEQYVLNMFAGDATTLNVSALQDAVNEKNRYLANKCTWQPDPDIAAQAGLYLQWDGLLPVGPL